MIRGAFFACLLTFLFSFIIQHRRWTLQCKGGHPPVTRKKFTLTLNVYEIRREERGSGGLEDARAECSKQFQYMFCTNGLRFARAGGNPG